MAYNQHNIHELARKYWVGETTPEEEIYLRDFFAYHSIPDGFEDLAAYLELTSEEAEGLSEDFDQKVLSQIEDHPKSMLFYLRPFLRVAAVVVVLAAGWWLLTDDEDAVADTQEVPALQIDDPEVREAFNQTKSALLLMSSKLSKAEAPAQHMKKFSETNESIKIDQK